MKVIDMNIDSYVPVLVSFDVLRNKICQGVGRDTVAKMSDDAGATIKVGKKRFCNVAKFQKYLDSICDDNDSS